MMDLVKLQQFVAETLRSCTALDRVKVEEWRKLRLQSQVDLSTLWLAGRNGRSGAGVLVELPEFSVDQSNPSGPSSLVTVPVAILEEPTLNFAPETGTLLSAEDIGQIVVDAFHQLMVSPFGLFFCGSNAMQPAEEFQDLVAYRVRLTLRYRPVQTERVATPEVSCPASTVTITCATPNAEIRYTLDGSFPGPSNSASLVYSAPFDVTTGDSLHVAAFKSGLNQSNVLNFTVT